jgi:hypothetical protein
VIRESIDSTHGSLQNGVSAYFGEFKRFPADFVDVKPFLEKTTRGAWEIVRKDCNQYVISYTGTKALEIVQLEYSATPDGNLETYRVVSTSRKSLH